MSNRKRVIDLLMAQLEPEEREEHRPIQIFQFRSTTGGKLIDFRVNMQTGTSKTVVLRDGQKVTIERTVSTPWLDLAAPKAVVNVSTNYGIQEVSAGTIRLGEGVTFSVPVTLVPRDLNVGERSVMIKMDTGREEEGKNAIYLTERGWLFGSDVGQTPVLAIPDFFSVYVRRIVRQPGGTETQAYSVWLNETLPSRDEIFRVSFVFTNLDSLVSALWGDKDKGGVANWIYDMYNAFIDRVVSWAENAARANGVTWDNERRAYARRAFASLLPSWEVLSDVAKAAFAARLYEKIKDKGLFAQIEGRAAELPSLVKNTSTQLMNSIAAYAGEALSEIMPEVLKSMVISLGGYLLSMSETEPLLVPYPVPAAAGSKPLKVERVDEAGGLTQRFSGDWWKIPVQPGEWVSLPPTSVAGLPVPAHPWQPEAIFAGNMHGLYMNALNGGIVQVALKNTAKLAGVDWERTFKGQSLAKIMQEGELDPKNQDLWDLMAFFLQSARYTEPVRQSALQWLDYIDSTKRQLSAFISPTLLDWITKPKEELKSHLAMIPEL